MPSDADTKQPSLRILSDRLLLVEGRDEINLFSALMKHCLDAEPEIQVIDAGGKDKFSRNLKAIQRFPLRVRSSGESAELSGAECEGQCLPSGLGRMQRAAMSIP